MTSALDFYFAIMTGIQMFPLLRQLFYTFVPSSAIQTAQDLLDKDTAMVDDALEKGIEIEEEILKNLQKSRVRLLELEARVLNSGSLWQYALDIADGLPMQIDSTYDELKRLRSEIAKSVANSYTKEILRGNYGFGLRFESINSTPQRGRTPTSIRSPSRLFSIDGTQGSWKPSAYRRSMSSPDLPNPEQTQQYERDG